MPKRSTTDTAREKECAEGCQSYQHANELNSAITLPPTGILDKQLASYFKSRCSNFAKLRDNYGRSLLHMAASCGRRDLTIWLLKMCAENINLAEIESGYTALHRSIAHGFINVAVVLIQMNANLNIKDNEDLCPLDMLLEDLYLPFVDKLFYIPRNYHSSHVPEVPLSNDPKTILAGKSHKKRNTDYDRFISFYNYKREFLDNTLNAFATEVYTWGTNLNYTSGFASENGKLNPEFLEFFERKNEIIIEISMQKFHTLFVSLSGKVWSCGIGQGGRLGLSSRIVLIPEQVPLTLPSVSDMLCVSVATGRDHSIFLCTDNRVFVCGMNKFHQLGISPPPASVTKPVQVSIGLRQDRILGVAASDFHSVVWTNSTIFTCGLNAGQLGHCDPENTIPNFREVPIWFPTILMVTVSKAATLVATDSYISVLTNYKRLKIELKSILRSIEVAPPWVRYQLHYDKSKKNYSSTRLIAKLVAAGGELNSEKMRSFSISPSTEELQIAVVFHDGSLYLWRKRDERFLKCYFLARYDISVIDVIMNSRGMWISTKKGEVLEVQPSEIIDFHVQLNDGFVYVPRCTRKSLSERTSDCCDCYLLHVKKLESAFRAVRIFSNPKGDNFAMLQFRSADFVKSLKSKNTFTLKTDLTKFYRETEDAGSFHDIIFKVKQKSFAAHKYILASCSEQFLKLKTDDGVVVIDDMSPEVFETILEFAYTGCCRIRKHPGHDSQYEVLLKRIQEAADSFKITEFANILEKIRRDFAVHPASDVLVDREVISFPRFNRLKFSSLYDIKLMSHDGTVFNAHKCILIARVEYFKNMLSGNWIESSNPHQSSCNVPFSSSVLNEILEYLYTDKISKSAENKDEQFWSSLLMAADQFMLTKLKEYSERALLPYLSVRNVVDLLMLADLVSARQLKTWCSEFICLNLSSILFFRYLDKINHQQLDQLTEYYRKEFNRPRFKKFPDIPVYSTVCDINKIFAAEQSYPIDWDVISDTNRESDDLVLRVERTKPKTKLKKLRKSITREEDSSTDQNSKNKIYSSEPAATLVVEESSVTKHEKLPEEEWVSVERQMKLVRSRLKVNAAIRECPQLIELKENYMPINGTKSSSVAKSSTDSKLDTSPRDDTTLVDSNYYIDINFSHLTPKVSQAERKRLRRVSGGSSKGSANLPSPGNSQKTELVNDCTSPGSPSGCWKALQQTSDSPTSFSSIMVSEMKQKTNVMKETRKIVTKSLHATQTEEQAIQELMTFYNVENVDDEHITVQRVTHEINVPQWVTR